jgi:hypothetical protein
MTAWQLAETVDRVLYTAPAGKQGTPLFLKQFAILSHTTEKVSFSFTKSAKCKKDLTKSACNRYRGTLLLFMYTLVYQVGFFVLSLLTFHTCPMDPQSLEAYLERRKVLSRSRTGYPYSSHASRRKPQAPSASRSSDSYDPISQLYRVPSLISLWRRSSTNPRLDLAAALEALRQELLELERSNSVILLTPSVVQSAMRANNHSLSAAKLWDRSPLHALAHANEAMINQLRTLLECYRTVAAHRIVSSRTYLESRRFFSPPPRLLRMHEEARWYFQEARHLQDSRVFRDAEVFNLARRTFRKAILVTEEILLT